MTTRILIKKGAEVVHDLTGRQGFTLDGVRYPADWLSRGGAIPPIYTVEPVIPPAPPPPPPPHATGAQMIYEADSRGALDTLSAALTGPEMMKLTARRRIIAGDDVAEAVRARLGVTAVEMASFIAAAAVRAEI